MLEGEFIVYNIIYFMVYILSETIVLKSLATRIVCFSIRAPK